VPPLKLLAGGRSTACLHHERCIESLEAERAGLGAEGAAQ
jgi:hypothetical protein